MLVLVVAPFAVAVALASCAPYLASRLVPAAATRLLALAALTVSLTCGLALSGVAVLGIARFGPVAAIGRWTTAMPGNSVTVPVGAVTGLVALGLFTSATLRAVRELRAIFGARSLAAALPALSAQLSIVRADEPVAFAVPGGTGRIVVSTAMLQALDADERRALLAHEAAHLRHHHHLYVALTDIATAAAPWLRPVKHTVRRSVERWADESAATELGDRRLVARSVGRAALAGAEYRRTGARSVVPAIALAADDGDVMARVRALMAPACPPRLWLRWTLLAATTSCWLMAAVLAVRAHAVLELAQQLPR